MSIPIGFIGISVLRLQTAGSLRELQEPVVVLSHNQPVAALVPYDWYVQALRVIDHHNEIAKDT